MPTNSVYEKPDGEEFVLRHNTPQEWAELVEAKLLKVGCSEKYAAAVAQGYGMAKYVRPGG